ncbi:Rieske 2Fe-2S domain-containing protein [Spirosoma sp. BT702]|uniref:Rieske 2Fe-2S domain-containing protein n=1 Tax=Spirosoma profusum TaxID=2771354 RepID=A0A927ASY5_9BACT|nr:Rieske 2Fe-2S domain-containing protein [Spirosoma profusum]MBD2701985.1 Rieske 2Fe-2S domain-containing protein [Spirosoma profusum]
METSFSSLDKSTMPRHKFFRVLGTGIGALLLTGSASACTPEENPIIDTTDAVQKIDFTLRLDDNANQNLKTKGGYVVVNNIIVAQTNDGKFVAASSKCTHDNTLLVYRPSANEFYCALDLSRFDITGKVIAGPATKALTLYNIDSNLTAGTLRVHN